MGGNMNLTLKETVRWFEELKKQGVSKKDILDVLEFDSDEHPDMRLLEEAKKIVYHNETEES